MGSLYLSSKIEDTIISTRDLINVFHLLTTTNNSDKEDIKNYEPMSHFGPTYYEWKDELIISEMQLLKRLGFNVYVCVFVLHNRQATYNNSSV